MRIREALSKERIVAVLKDLGKLRIKISHSAIMTVSALLLVVFVAFVIRTFPMRWEIQVGSMHLSEFDPYFQFRFTEYLVNNGFISWNWPVQWVDTQRWYPRGINVASSGFPGLPFTSAFIYRIISTLGVNIELMDFCALLPPIMGALACLAIFFLGRDYGGRSVGLFAALFLALSPSFLQRTSVGFYDDEIIGIPALIVFLVMFLRSIEENRPLNSSLKYAVGSGLVLGYFCAGWGAAYYPIGVAIIFVLALILLKRYSQRLLLSYSLTFGLGLLIAINVPRLSPTYLTTAPILPVAAVLGLLCLYELSRALISTRRKVIFIIVFLAILLGGFIALWQLGYMQDIAGKFWSVINPFARLASPLTESVAEHRISSWSIIYFEFGIGILFFIVGFYFILRNLNNRNLFLLILSLSSLYFAGSMVRLLVLLAPAFSLMAAIGIVGVIKPFNMLLKEPPKILTKKKYSLEHVGKEFSGTTILLIFIIMMTQFAFSPQTGGMPKVYMQAYSPVTITAASLPVAPLKPVNEWLDMMEYVRQLGAGTVVCSWWDYGYWLTALGNVTSLADNATIDLTKIQNVGFIFMANETQALRMLKLYNATYILVFVTVDTRSGNVGNWRGYGDEGKWGWMARISGGGHERLEAEGYMDPADEWTDSLEGVAQKFGNYTLGTNWVDSNNNRNEYPYPEEGELVDNARGQSTTIYKLMSYAVNRWKEANDIEGQEAEESAYFKEAFIAGLTLSTTEAANYGSIVPLVCLYEIKYPSS